MTSSAKITGNYRKAFVLMLTLAVCVAFAILIKGFLLAVLLAAIFSTLLHPVYLRLQRFLHLPAWRPPKRSRSARRFRHGYVNISTTVARSHLNCPHGCHSAANSNHIKHRSSKKRVNWRAVSANFCSIA